jgi:hypothetical protein
MQLLVEPFDAFVQLALELEQSLGQRSRQFGAGGLQGAALPLHSLHNLLGDDRPYAAQILANLLHLAHDPHQELQIPIQIAERRCWFGRCRSEAFAPLIGLPPGPLVEL